MSFNFLDIKRPAEGRSFFVAMVKIICIFYIVDSVFYNSSSIEICLLAF